MVDDVQEVFRPPPPKKCFGLMSATFFMVLFCTFSQIFHLEFERHDFHAKFQGSSNNHPCIRIAEDKRDEETKVNEKLHS